MSQPPNDPFSDPANHPAAPANPPPPPAGTNQPPMAQPVQAQPLPDQPMQAQLVQPPLKAPVHPGQQGDTTGGLIPYKNPQALIGYYAAIFSLIPILGNFLGLVAVILGILGLNYHKKNRAVSGVAHAWVGIILGSITFLGYNSCVIYVVASGILGSNTNPY